MIVSVNKLAFLGFYLNGAAGSGKYDQLTIQRVKAAIDDARIFDVLQAELGDDLDVSIIDAPERAELVDEWQNYVNAVNESRKMCVDRGGLNLLVAYLLEGIQRRTPRRSPAETTA